MIYRFLSADEPVKGWRIKEVDFFGYPIPLYVPATPTEGTKTKMWQFGKFGGAWIKAGLGMSGLKAPKKLKNKRVKFYFTEKGYKKFGPQVISDAKKRDLVLKVICEKNPEKSRIVYSDMYQVALLPPNRK
jgi:hypothetical protein